MSITHVVTFTWTEGTDADTVTEIAAVLRAFVDAAGLTGLRSWTCGSDAGLTENNADFAVVAVFDDEDGYRAYRDHPEHRRIIAERIAPLIGSRSAVQFAA